VSRRGSECALGLLLLLPPRPTTSTARRPSSSPHKAGLPACECAGSTRRQDDVAVDQRDEGGRGEGRGGVKLVVELVVEAGSAGVCGGRGAGWRVGRWGVQVGSAGTERTSKLDDGRGRERRRGALAGLGRGGLASAAGAAAAAAGKLDARLGPPSGLSSGSRIAFPAPSCSDGYPPYQSVPAPRLARPLPSQLRRDEPAWTTPPSSLDLVDPPRQPFSQGPTTTPRSMLRAPTRTSELTSS